MVLIGVLLLTSRESWISLFLAGLSFALAFLTKMVSLIAFGGTFVALIIQLQFAIFRDKQGLWKTLFKKVIFLFLGFGFPLIGFEGLRRMGLGSDLHLERWIRNGTYILKITALTEIPKIMKFYQQGAGVFLDRIILPFISLVLMMGFAGWILRKDDHLKKLYYLLLAVFVFHSAWWFFYSVHWVRHYLIAMLVVILALALPASSFRIWKWRSAYLLLLVMWSSLAWKQVGVPFEGINGISFEPTAKMKAQVEVSALLSDQVGDELVITQNGYTVNDIRYLSDEELRVTYFRENRQYNPPFWIAVNTKFMNQQDPAFMRLLRECSGLRDYEGYLVGRCE